MILPIYAYGQPVLKQKSVEIKPDYPNLKSLIANMWETMYYASGVGIAAPQIGLAIRLFVIDSTQSENEERVGFVGFKRIFINAKRIEPDKGDKNAQEEGCLSIPGIRGEVTRASILHLEWLDENFEKHSETFDGLNARIIQHEYDHTEGILFTEHLTPIKRNLIRNKLENIRRGKIDADYKLKVVGR